MILSDFIQSFVEQTGYTYGRGEQSWHNIIADDEILPVVYLDEPIKSKFVVGISGVLQEVFDITLFVLHKSQLDWTPQQHGEVIELARQEARALITLINNSDSVKSFSEVNVLEAKNVLNANLSGVMLTASISFYNNNSVCLNASAQSDFVQLSNSNNEWERSVPNGGSYSIPDTFVEVVDQDGNVITTVNIPSVTGSQIIVDTTGGNCDDAVIINSNETYSQNVASGDTFILPDTTINFNVSGNNYSETIPTLSNQEINIVWQ